MSNREVMQQALVALENERYVSTQIVDAITALRTALEQPEQEPCKTCSGTGQVETGIGMLVCCECHGITYDTPPAAQRKPLTEEKINFECRKHFWMHGTRFEDAYKVGFRDSEAAHNIKEMT